MARPAYTAATADKFVVRLPDGLRKKVEEFAALNHTSMNTEVIRAIEAHLEGQARQKLLLDALQAQQQASTPTKPQAPASKNDVDYLDGLKSSTR